MRLIKHIIIKALVFLRPVITILLALPLAFLAMFSRFANRKIDVGLGPEPLINNVHHKKALMKYGYTAETFVNHTYFITSEFDVYNKYIYSEILMFLRAIFNYKCIYIYFNGGPLAWSILRPLEPYYYKLAGVKVVVMPYGGDVHDLRRCPNKAFYDAMMQDYPLHQKLNGNKTARQVKRWQKHADHVISGCDWVYYMDRWDTLMTAHFSVDTNLLKPSGRFKPSKTLRVFHAPNHKAIKGTEFFVKAIEELKAEGCDIELKVIQKVPNEEIRRILEEEVDVVAEQLIIGWHGIFALEAMAFERPVLCYLADDLLKLFTDKGLIEKDENPIINTNVLNVKERLKYLLDNRDKIPEIGRKSREYVIKHHSLEAVGKVFDEINRKIQIRNKH